MAKGQLFLFSLLAFIIGLGLASFIDFPRLFWLVFLFLSLILALLACLDRRFLFAGLLPMALALGGLRGQAGMSEIFRSELRNLNGTGQVVVLSGLVDQEPDVKEKSQQLRLKLSEKDILLVLVGRYPEYRYGDRVEVMGKLETPENLDGFDYQNYLRKDGIYSLSPFPQVKLLAREEGNPVRRALFAFKGSFQSVWRRFLSPPQLGLFEALVFGEEENIPSEWKEKLNFSGTRHLTAVSGMNITIISVLLSGFLLSLGFWRQQAGIISLIFVWLFILMIGAPASALRAGVMVSFFLLGQTTGRLVNGSPSLVLAAVFLLAQNPLLLRFDVGFQLSFLAMAGLISWSSFFQEKVFKSLPELLKSSLSTTFAAQVFTLPILIYNFGYFSLVSPLTNLLLVPLVPFLTLVGFIGGILGMIFWPLGQVFSWLLWLGMSALLLIIDLSLKIPFSYLNLGRVPPGFLVLALILLTGLTRKINRPPGPKFLSF